LGWNLHGTTAAVGDLVQLVGLGHKHFMIELTPDAELHTHRGIVHHNELIGKTWGTQILSHLGSPFFIMQPALADLLRLTPRISQILYPKDIGFILISMGIGPGQTVVEAGTGSGAFTTALAFSIGSTGKVITYEKRADMQERAQKNLSKVGLADRVTFKLKDIQDGFDEKGIDALFLDLPNPFDYLDQVKVCLKPGGYFGTILPTVNQVSRMLIELRRKEFAFIEVVEILMRYYKPEPDRLRPVDRMIAHTGFLIFARPVVITEKETAPEEFEHGEKEHDA
jgi:tRNA (adenine57-N1/adenine58-N1)-methyltransferase catalytic subunit